MTTVAARIRVIAIAIIRRGDEILVYEGVDRVTGAHYYRPLGGGIEPSERAIDAVVREIREELGVELVDVRSLGILENLFTLDGTAGHQIVFVFEGRVADPGFYTRTTVEAVEVDGSPIDVKWRRLDGFDVQHRLVPDGLLPLLVADA